MKTAPIRIASIDDVPTNHDIMAHRLGSGFELTPHNSALSILKSMETEDFDVFIIDVHMPIEDGFIVAQKVMTSPHYKGQPLLFATYDQTFSVISRCLKEVGADYISRAASAEELRARVHSLFELQQQKTLRLGQLAVDPMKVSATMLSRPLDLTLTEFKILTFLLTRKDRCIHRDYLQKQVWGEEAVSEKTLNSHLSNLRLKLVDGGISLQVDRKGLVEIQIKR